MFKLDKLKDTYEWPIKLELPNGGSNSKYDIKVKFNRLPHDERQTLLSRLSELDSEATPNQQLMQIEGYMADMIDRVFAGWVSGQIQDAEGNDFPDTDENKAYMLNVSEFRAAVFKGYQESQGGKKASEGKLIA